MSVLNKPTLSYEEAVEQVKQFKFPYITAESIEEKIINVQYIFPENTTLTICIITVNGGFSVRGESSCIDPRNFDPEKGKTFSYKDAFGKLFGLEAYHFMARQHEAKMAAAAQIS